MSTSCPNKQYSRHSEYYIPDANLHLLVDNMLFRVHSFFFERDSAKFRAVLEAPIAPNTARSGSSDSKPIVIKNSSPSEFARFLFIFYNPTYSDYTDLSASDWTSVLKTACEHEFVEVQNCAIRGLQTCDLTTVDRIYIYELYKADPKYIVPLYVEMAKREEAPTDEEVKRLGSDTSLLIFRLREYLRSRPGLSRKSPLPANVNDDDAIDAVCLFLRLDRSRMQNSGSSPTNCKGKKACPNSKAAKSGQ
ncbi:hypothetical protein BJ912DRAFT_357882 [Pholiota molesta]|nr:hypothetical protein BJ912DRAFT_357882 [Pholiota molesta]